jgi:guanylate kinase
MRCEIALLDWLLLPFGMSVVFVLSGPSGSGKTTLVRSVLKRFGHKVGLSVSCTTRFPRCGESDSVDYHFISRGKFESLVGAGEFIEHVECCGNLYGTLKRSVYAVLQEKHGCILDIEYEGAYNVLHEGCLPVRSIGVLILPPSIRCLRERLVRRGSETTESLDVRLSAAFSPSRVPRYDHVIVNKDVDAAANELCLVISSCIR